MVFLATFAGTVGWDESDIQPFPLMGANGPVRCAADRPQSVSVVCCGPDDVGFSLEI